MQTMSDTKNSILQMARGAIAERVDYEMNRVIDNILDPNTKATGKRKIVLTIEFQPDDTREVIPVSVTAKSTLVPTNPVTTSLCIVNDRSGEVCVAEMVPQVPGQMDLGGEVQESPKILKLVKAN